MTPNGLWASFNEQRVVKRLGVVADRFLQFDILQSGPACGRPNAAHQLKRRDFMTLLGSVAASSINIPAEPKTSGVIC